MCVESVCTRGGSVSTSPVGTKVGRRHFCDSTAFAKMRFICDHKNAFRNVIFGNVLKIIEIFLIFKKLDFKFTFI